MIWIHLGLFVLTFLTTLIAGMPWITGQAPPWSISSLSASLPYAGSLMFIITCHEFGHYFASRYHKIESTLPFYIPFPPISLLNFGTMGAVIKTKGRIQDNSQMMDIGAYGPIAGFIATVIVLLYGFATLPGPEYILKIHPDYFSGIKDSDSFTLFFGDNLLFAGLRQMFSVPGKFIPPMSEIYHYPYLLAGWLGLFITAMNMIPVGQLDGGHVIYAMFGNRIHQIISSVFLVLIFVLGFIGLADFVFETKLGFGWPGWLLWAIILYFVVKPKHPPVYKFEKLDKKRLITGIITIIIFILAFSPVPFSEL